MTDESGRASPHQIYASPTPQRRRRPRRQKRPHVEPVARSRATIALVFTGLLLLGGLYYTLAKSARYAVLVGDTPVVVMETREDAERAIQDLREKYAPGLPHLAHFAEGEPRVRLVMGRGRAPGPAKAVELLDRALTVEMQGYAIFVNGTPLVLLATKDEAVKAIALALEAGARGRAGVPTFKERVVIAPKRFAEGEERAVPMMTSERAAAALVYPASERYHTVKAGDSFWIIANANGITVQQLRDLNPALNHARLRIGDKVRLPDLMSPVTVVVRDGR